MSMNPSEIIIQMHDHYPFHGSLSSSSSNSELQVRKRVQFGAQPRFVMKEKVRMLKNLGFQHLVGLQATAEAENHLDLLFQFVPFSFHTRFSSLAAQNIEKIKEGMYQLAEHLVAKGVEHEFRVENMGVDNKENLKYFLGLAFRIDRSMNREDTINRYRRTIDGIFANNSPMVHPRSPNKSLRNDTADSSSKTAEDTHHVLPTDHSLPAAHLMKKSSTVNDSPNQQQLSRQMLTRYTFNCNNQLTPHSHPHPQQQAEYREQKVVETKAVKMDELGARINRLKNYMKEITGKTPTGTSGLTKFSVKMDTNNLQNRILQENKIMITPSYTKLQKKISEFRESKLYRAYNHKEILYSNKNQGYQVLTTHKIQDHSNHNHSDIKAVTQPDIKAITQPDMVQTNTKVEKRLQTEGTRRVPSFFSKRQNSNNNNNQLSIPTSSIANKPRPSEQPITVSLTSIASQQNNPHSSHQIINANQPESQQTKEYRQLASKDKYCEEFLFFLEDHEEEEEKITNPIQSIQNSTFPPAVITPGPTPSFCPNTQLNFFPAPSKKIEPVNQNKEIQDRVNKAIRNSIRLISNLKSKE